MIVIVWNCLHVPALRSPLYSLCRHKYVPECGTFSHYDAGSYILFPNFALQVDNSYDNTISYKSIRCLTCSCLDYAEPRVSHASTKNATIVPPDSNSIIDDPSTAMGSTAPMSNANTSNNNSIESSASKSP